MREWWNGRHEGLWVQNVEKSMIYENLVKIRGPYIAEKITQHSNN